MADRYCPQCKHSQNVVGDPPRLRCKASGADLMAEESLCMVRREAGRVCGPEGNQWEAVNV